MSSRSETIAGTLAMLSHARRSRKRPQALVKDRTLQTLVTDLVAARTAAGMTQHEVAMRMWTTNQVYRSYFPEDRRPARTCVGVTGLARNALVEIDLIARRSLTGQKPP